MAGSWTIDRFPQFEAPLRRLTDQHRELVDEPLHLAISYLPATRDQQDIFLFEVASGFAEGINPERDLFEVTYLPASGFPMGPNEQLHLILTNPHELEIGLEEGWPVVSEIVNAVRAEDYRVLYADDIGQRLLITLQAATQIGRAHV